MTNDEDGLRGCWFEAKIVGRAANYALVAYKELQDEADESMPLKEWFHIPGRPSRDSSDVPSGHPCHLEPGFHMRPLPVQQQVSVNVYLFYNDIC